jgi:hypothetical protein
VKDPIDLPRVWVETDHPGILAQKVSWTMRLHIVPPMTDRRPALDSCDPHEQAIAGLAGNGSAEIAGAPAQNANKVIRGLPGEIAGQVSR